LSLLICKLPVGASPGSHIVQSQSYWPIVSIFIIIR